MLKITYTTSGECVEDTAVEIRHIIIIIIIMAELFK
jgi:hypothetical protein